MPYEMSEDQRANLRLDQINGDLSELKASMKEQKDLLNSPRLDMASLKTEVRIVGGIIFASVGALIAIVLNHSIP